MRSWVLVFALAVSATALSPAQADRPTAPDVGEAGTAGRSTGLRPGWGWGAKPEYRMIDGDRVYRVGGAVLAPRLLKRARPHIPESACGLTLQAGLSYGQSSVAMVSCIIREW